MADAESQRNRIECTEMDQQITQFVRTGRFKDALIALDHLPTATRRSPELLLAEGELLVETGNLTEGLSIAQRALARVVDPAHKAVAYRLSGQIAFYRGDAKEWVTCI